MEDNIFWLNDKQRTKVASLIGNELGRWMEMPHLSEINWSNPKARILDVNGQLVGEIAAPEAFKL